MPILPPGSGPAAKAFTAGPTFSFALGPVQTFIEAARSVRDLWTGSAILSWLAFTAMRPVIDSLGPTSFVYPSLSGNPTMDLWLRRVAGIDGVPMPELEARKSPSLPNRFIAVVPWGANGTDAKRLAEQCERSVREAWKTSVAAVRGELAPELAAICPDWDRLWSAQTADFFEVRTTVVPERALDDETMARLIGGRPFDEVWPDAAAIRALSSAIPSADRPSYRQDAAGQWQAQLELSARVMDANRAIRKVPANGGGGDTSAMSPPKCSLFGSWEQMGPASLRESASFWDNAASRLNVDGVRLRTGERLCAVALAKRFAGPAFLAGEFALDRASMRFPDTATVSAATWLREAGIDPDAVRSTSGGRWSGRWLHGSDGEEEPPPRGVAARIEEAVRDRGRPPSYFAVLKMDGDDIGSWLRGERSPPLKEVMHPGIVTWFQGIGGTAVEAALAARRPVGPALHASISEMLGAFAARIAPEIVRQHDGTVIYSGGDDLLALLPSARAVACAQALRQAFRSGADGTAWCGMGTRATVSAGIAYVHHMEDLRLALRAAREAEARAKAEGKDALHLYFMRRSGENAGATVDWPLTPWFTELTELFACDASSRWTYRLRSEQPVLAGPHLPPEAVSAEIRRLGDRIDDRRWDEHALRAGCSAGELIRRWWERYRDALRRRTAIDDDSLRSFVTLCQGAAFVARGGDG